MSSDNNNEDVKKRDAFLGLAECEVEIEELEKDVELYRLKKMVPFYKQRDSYINDIPGFWRVVLSQHSDFANYIRASDFKYIDQIEKIQLEWLILKDENESNVRDFSVTFYFNGIEDDFEEQIVTKTFKIVKSDTINDNKSTKKSNVNEDISEDENEEEIEDILTSEPVDIKWPASYDSINPSVIVDKRSPEGKKKYRQGMKSFFGWFKWTGKKPGKEFPHGDDLAVLISEDLYPYCVKYYTEAQRDLEDENNDSDEDSSEEPLDLPGNEEDDDDAEQVEEEENDPARKKLRRA
ncbi:Vps75p NDAI_0F03970 [Naumovozyma dairenensis CBS 421]|uniref:Vacuolar protein sorting-associated protein 75 n=1 Tax=Naumovozyma dairenensis (strain ATCC 10597 / BCRC 20456 / CBS 421 / NBRC 0211 / NRRL Y-12639) TaxID=1071378 RepID=G0WD54_NAUDC|nr:hypothetical protein NDAI_0F03970 [Naumovozyma dairenensis CBS 421]CCD25715.1 hypothetical protein NDAI_0F03970 [Naumovozyma dairenensis CBS 421]